MRVEVNETRMLRWACGLMKKDKIRNEQVRGSVKVAPVQISAEKKDEMVWMDGWRGEGDNVRRRSDAQLPGKRQRQRQKPRWKDSWNIETTP